MKWPISNNVLMNLLVKRGIDSKIFFEPVVTKPVVTKLSTNTSTSGISPDVAELKDMVKALLFDKKSQNQSPAPVKAVKESYVTCGSAHSYHNCPATDGNVYPYQAPAYQAPAPETQGVSKEDFSTYVKANDAVTRNIQTQGQNMQNQLTNLTNLITKFVNSNSASTSSSGTLPSNTIANPRSDLKAITTQSDLGASINLMPFSMWKRLYLPDLTTTCMNLELTDRLISRPVGVAKDVYVKVRSFHFLADFVVIDFDADPRVPLILERLFLKTERVFIDVFDGKLTLRVGKVAITFNLDQTSRYSANYSDKTAKQINVINMACEEYSQEVLGFSDKIASGNPTPYYDLIVSTTSSTLSPFENSDFLLEEVDAFLTIKDDPTSP
uniref:Reverse transcriptase domain-containing protein n=1 Tax=Tanacetum cinerariifolium TaxID=118510 RepID=A0A699K3P3_TANCI|nr:reverse transcriptase domain-containing protein [Tanacetum cinerariifolium]